MVAQPDGRTPPKRGNTWHKRRVPLAQKVLRSTISHGAKTLWCELAFNWAWNDPVCFPSQDVLSLALGSGKNTLTRWMNELVKVSLVTREKVNREYRYTLAEELPVVLTGDEWRFNNALLTQRVKNSRKEKRNPVREIHDAPRSQSPKQGLGMHEPEITIPVLDEANPQNGDWGLKASPQNGDCERFSIPKMGIATSRMKEEKQDEGEKNKQDELKEECESEIRTSKVGGSGTHGTSRCALGSEATNTVRVNEIIELMDDEAEISPKSNRNKRKRRGPSAALVSGVIRPKVPFPEAIGSSMSDDQVDYDKGPDGIPAWTSADVLRLLSDEAEEKFGPKGSRGLPPRLTSKLSGQIDKAILQIYEPDVVRDMIRLLVWDWETARGVCFPYRPDQKYPDPLSLVQYVKELAPRIETGFSRDTAKRGGVNSYKDLFLDKKDLVNDDDPY
jgi:hypothetical protein